MKNFILILLACLPPFGHGLAGAASQPPAHAPARIELRDQYDAPQRLAFPGTNLVVLTLADKKGAEQIDGWVTALKARYAGRIELRGLADVGTVPGWLRGTVRKKFRETRTYPVMMDWSGKVVSELGCQPGLASVLVIGPEGNIHARMAGPAHHAALKELFTVIDAALLQSAPLSTNITIKSAGYLPP